MQRKHYKAFSICVYTSQYNIVKNLRGILSVLRRCIILRLPFEA